MSRMAVTIAEAAHRLELHPSTTNRLFHSGDLEGYRKTRGGQIMIYVDSIETYIREVQGRPVPAALEAR